MAPIMLESDLDDDFVRTISDDDTTLPGSEEEEEDPAVEKVLETKHTSNKRKLDEINGSEDHSQKKTKKKSKINSSHTQRLKEFSSKRSQTDVEDETWTTHGEDDGAMDSDFEFQVQDADKGLIEGFDGWDLGGVSSGRADQKQSNKKGVDIDELIARRREKIGPEEEKKSDDQAVNGLEDDGGAIDEFVEKFSEGKDVSQYDLEEDETLAEDAFGMGAALEDEEEAEEEDAKSGSDSGSGSDSEAVGDEMPDPDDVGSVSSADEAIDPSEQARRDAFFAPEEAETPPTNSKSTTNSFQTFSLSRPILRGLASVGFANPTPIQKKAIPVALLGKDVVGGAVTGSGKTAAFIVPIIERLLYRPKKVPTSRVAILMPTRELAVQCFNVARKLASYTDVTFCQLVGGFSLREQEAVLRSRPDVIIATPGRFIDHMRNSPSFTVETLEILVLDEADRMLEDGFADELNEILTTIPKSRQTMLFSATMTDSVDKLIRVGLNRPVRLLIDAQKQTVGTLVQEFVRLRPGREGMRLGYLVYLCHEVFTDRVIVFFRQKKEAHRARIIFGLLGIKAAELHGSMSQEQVPLSLPFPFLPFPHSSPQTLHLTLS